MHRKVHAKANTHDQDRTGYSIDVQAYKKIFGSCYTNMRKKRFTPKVDDARDVAECQEDAQNDKAGAYEIGQ